MVVSNPVEYCSLSCLPVTSLNPYNTPTKVVAVSLFNIVLPQSLGNLTQSTVKAIIMALKDLLQSQQPGPPSGQHIHQGKVF